MEKVIKAGKNKSLTKPVGLFSFTPLAVSGTATFFFYEAWWPVALLTAPALWASLNFYGNHAKWELARLWSKTQFDYDLDTESTRYSFDEAMRKRVIRATDALPLKTVYSAMFTRRPFEFTLEHDENETYGSSTGTKAVFNGKEIAVQQVSEPSVFSIWEDALNNARKLK